MIRTLYIFVTTNRPDQYLNPIVHCIKEEGINHIVFLQVEDSKTEQVNLNSLYKNVYDLLEMLSLGNYKYYIGKDKGKIIGLDTEYNTNEIAQIKALYKSYLTDKIRWEVERINYLKLKQYISYLSKNNKNVIIDVTSVAKTYIGDIIACCLIENIANLYTFDLLVEPDFDKPWKTLIHNLQEDKQYKYVNLVQTPVFVESTKSILIRTTPLFISIIGTVIFVTLALVAIFIFGSSSIFVQTVSTVGTVLGIISFFLIYFPVRGK